MKNTNVFYSRLVRALKNALQLLCLWNQREANTVTHNTYRIFLTNTVTLEVKALTHV
ncbi:hypothetical protein RO3G_08708 [Rhizopus delemar RA 99-880]|uniref:Uncharacterized protein n=1 Tax=Rhizopus delemar (strain RA 99-880 / ATCC MYA-4621 / FGSC 9543 / NRRL 43880) TaxID=246409 RepID=I1C6C3_RHIO9|nr:hypothetical protein RO3G_08708 [Rhizopus delemar RA 99-880]|eukprot:EIE84003.1 hypothetical protein RO3G_08708 [Rhizopus delemar RA 99-880]